MKALIIVLMLVLVTVHVWLSHKRFHGPSKLFLKDEIVQLGDGVTMRTEYLDRILEGSVSGPDAASAAMDSLRGINPPGRVIDLLDIPNKSTPVTPALAKVVDEVALLKPSPASQPTKVLLKWSDQMLKLSGQVRDESVVMAVRKALPNKKIVDQLVVDGNKTQGPEWSDQFGPMLRDFFADNPKSAEIEIDHQSIRFKREVVDLSAKKKLASMARGLLPRGKYFDQVSVRQVVKEKVAPVVSVPKPSEPATVLATLSNKRLTITGRLPNQQQKELLTKLAESTLAGVQISNQIVVDPKAIKEPSWNQLVPVLFGAFWSIRPDAAEFEINANQLRIRQKMKSEPMRDLLLVKARRLANSSKLKLVDQLTIIKPKPRVRPAPQQPAFALKSTSVPGRKTANILVTYNKRQLTLSGNVPSDEMRLSIRQAALAAQPNAKITNDIAIDKEIRLPAWDLKVLDLLTEFLSSPTESEFEVNTDKIRLKQALPSDAVKDKWIAKAKRFMPGSNRFVDQLTVSPQAPMPTVFVADYQPAPKPDVKVDLEIESLDIYFLTNSTWVKPEHEKEINKTVSSINSMSYQPIIEVKGFADQRGSYELNKSLSEGRAEEVVSMLVKYGLSRNNIQVLAVGEVEASGASERDRRVEVRVLGMR